MSLPSSAQVSQRLKAAGVPYNSNTIQTLCGEAKPLCGCQGRGYHVNEMGVRKFCGCTAGAVDGDDRPSLPSRRSKW